jgi:hypothetical protein
MELPTEGLGQQSDDPAFQPQDDWGEGVGPDDLAEAGKPGELDEVAEVGEWGEVNQVGALDGQRPATGEPRVDAALARLDELAGRPVTEHRAIFEDVHRRLRDVLGELDTRDPSPAEDASGAGRRAGR